MVLPPLTLFYRLSLSGVRPEEVEGTRVVEKNVGNDSPSEEEFRFHTVGEQLKAERERQGFTLSDLAAKTRVPMRHLDAIEKSDFGALPGTTYTLGFARSYARAVGMDAAKVSADLRSELAEGGHEGYQAPTQNYEPTDPSRVPSRSLAWTAAVIGVIVVAAYFIWRSMTLDASVDAVANAPIQTKTAKAPAIASQVATPGGAVVLTATDNVWVKIYDADDKRLYENEMKAGDSFSVPADANKPMIVTGRPQVLNVTVDGKPVAPLGSPDKTIADVEVSAAALLARAQAQTATPAASAASESNPN
jgi:cytoskeleton protein RodZ